jgi:tRNA1(Val) A37 N6-methylase TrmN6
VVVDLCCGSGAVGAALAAAVDDVELHGVDIDPAAVACARRNLVACGGRVYEGDLYAPLPAWLRGRVDVLVANAPYVPPGRSGCCLGRLACTSRGWRWTGAPTGLRWCGGSAPRRQDGWPQAAIY